MKRFLIISLLIFPSLVFSHDGGHYESGALLKVWQLKNGQTEEGNFAYGTENGIIIEKLKGEKKAISLDELAPNDRRIAEIKLTRYQSLHPNKPSSPSYHVYYLWVILVLIGLLLRFFLQWIPSFHIRASIGFVYLVVVVLACKTETAPSPSNPNTPSGTTTIPKTSTSFLDSAFAPYKNYVTTNYDGTYYYVNSNGMPEHNMMVGITSWQQQVPIPQPYTGTNHWSIPLNPVYETNPMSTKTNFMKGAVALAVNGIPIFNALNNRGEDSFAIGELDQWGGHCGRADDYHYHAAPLHLSSQSGLKPIAFALDGFAVYGSKEPDGTEMKTLDANHGHVGSNSIYHYHGTADYPYVIGSMRGKVSTDPTTPAPENQILPQAFASVVRPALTALKGATITNFQILSPTSYLLTYQLNGKNNTVKYSWQNNIYTFVFTDGDGKQSTETYVRK